MDGLRAVLAGFSPPSYSFMQSNKVLRKYTNSIQLFCLASPLLVGGASRVRQRGCLVASYCYLSLWAQNLLSVLTMKQAFTPFVHSKKMIGQEKIILL
jgi:hypothetical protein